MDRTKPTDAVSGCMFLADLGSTAMDLFRKVDKALKERADEAWPEDLFVAESERFELWAANMGLFIVGHGSLDYRVREAESLAQTLRRFMQDLINSLDDVFQICSGASQQGVSETDKTSGECSEPETTRDNDEDEDDEESDVELLLDGVRDPINRLFKISTKIRNPSTRLGSSRAANYRQVDEETGVDFLQAIKGPDMDYVRSLFLEFRKIRARQGNHPAGVPGGPPGENDDEVWEQIRTALIQEQEWERTGANSYLIKRIAQANVRRRQQFAYWARHRDKLDKHTKAYQAQKGRLPNAQRNKTGEFPSLMEFTPGAVSSVTTATRLDIARLEISDNRSNWTISEYAPSTRQAAHASVEFPPAPKLLRNTPSDKFFECPYCFFLCPKETLADKAWKAHLIHDMRPYICTYEDCRNPSQLYDSRQDWVQHENSEHRKIWRCLDHSNQVFERLVTYQRHLLEQHAGSISDEASLNRIVQASESVSDIVDRACPICTVKLDTARATESHIALHLERFARFSLPRSVINDDDGSNADSGKANKVDEEDSRNDDFEDCSKLYSDMDASEIRFTGQPPEVSSSNPLHGIEFFERQAVDSQTFDDDEELDCESDQDHREIQQHPDQEAKSDPFILGEWCTDFEKYENAEKSHRGTLEHRENVLGREHPDTLASMSNLALLLSGQKKWHEAEEIYRKLVGLREKALGQDDSETLDSMVSLVDILYELDKYMECEQISRNILEQREKTLGHEHPDTLATINNLAVLLQKQGKFKESESIHREVLGLREKALGPEDPNTLCSTNNLAITLQNLGHLEEAEKLNLEVMDIRKRTLGPTHPETISSMDNLALTLRDQGRWQEAEKLHVEAVEAQKQRVGHAHPDTLRSMARLAWAWHSQKRIADAIALMESCVQLGHEVLGPGHPDTSSFIETLETWRAEQASQPLTNLGASKDI